MKQALLTTLRDKNSTQSQFRNASDKLAELLAAETAENIELTESPVETPICTARGYRPKAQAVLVPILRAGIALLPAYMRLFDDARVGFFGIRRDEATAQPCLYYENLPYIGPDDRIIILDPMLATAGSALLVLHKLAAMGIEQKRMTLVSIIAAPEGFALVQERYPSLKIQVAVLDERLNEEKFIVPGLGDYGDRYFGKHSAT